MATGTGFGFDLTRLETQFKKLDSELDKIMKKGEKFQTSMDNIFSNLGKSGIQSFNDQLIKLRQNVNKFGKQKVGVKWDSEGLQKYIDDINKLILVIKSTQNASKKEGLKVVSINGLRKEVKEAQELLKLVKRAEKDLADTTNKRQQSYKGSIKYSDNAKTIEQERQAIVNLEAARNKLKKTDADYAVKLEELNKRINAHRISIEDATKTDAQRNALTSSTRAEYARLLAEQEKLTQSIQKMQSVQARTGVTAENQKALDDLVNRHRDVQNEILKYKQSANGKLDATERKFLADQAAIFAENEKRKTDILQQEQEKRRAISSTEAKQVITNTSDAKSINQHLAAIQRLENAKKNLDTTDVRYKKTVKDLNNEIKRHQRELDKAGYKTDELKNKKRGLGDVAGQLQRRLAMLFSVSQISGYIMKVVQVRGEFEMYNRSLQVLLQNKDEANELWDKTVALAVKSPFTVSDLIRNTKQLAAYRVEAEKLYETNKMLSDVSAGLGVDMNRLILAFGQVKAANYLRGTELRQFSEAGVNMLGELAEYFSELEGRAVSVGDVFERVSKRMVSFADVEEIFKRITGEGGLFYQMQEKQSETLKGIRMNLRDSIDLMLNDMGKMNEDTLKSFFEMIRRVVKEWRTLLPAIESAGIAFIAYFGTATLIKIARGFKAVFSIISAHPIIAITTAIAAAIAITYKWAKAQSKVNAALQEVEKNINESLTESIGLYRELTDTIRDVTKSSNERNKAYDNLKKKFEEILPDQMLERDYIESLSFNYKKAEDAMFSYYNAKSREQKKDKINQLFEQDFQNEIDDIVKQTLKNIDKLNDKNLDNGKITEKKLIDLRSSVERIVTSVVESAKDGSIELEKVQDEIRDRLLKFADLSLADITYGIYGGYNNQVRIADAFAPLVEGWDLVGTDAKLSDLIGKLKEYRTELLNISGMPYETREEEEAAEILNNEKKKVELAKKYFSDVVNLYSELAKAKSSLTGDELATKEKDLGEDYSKIWNEILGVKELENYRPILEDAFKKLSSVAQKGSFEYNRSLQNIKSEFIGTEVIDDEKRVITGGLALVAQNAISNIDTNGAARELVLNFQESLRDEGKKLNPTEFQENVEKAFELAAKKGGVSVDLFSKFVPDSETSRTQLITKLQAEVENFQDQVKSYEKSIEACGDDLTPAIVTNTKTKIDELKKNIPVLEHAIRLLGGDPNKDKSKKESIFDERLRVIKELHKAYKELRKAEDEAASTEGAFQKYKQAFIDAYKGTNLLPQGTEQMSGEEFAKFVGFPTEDGMIKFFDDLKKLAKDKEDEIKVGLAKGEVVWESRIEFQVKSLDDLTREFEKSFNDYEMTIDLKAENIPADLAKNVFGVDYIDLDTIRKNVVAAGKDFYKLGEEGEKAFRETLDKVSELEDKQRKENAKKYVKYLVKGQGERIRIKMEEIRAIEEIENANYTKAQKETAIRGVQEETQKELDKLKWEDFKDSGMYVQLFEDLEYASTKSIKKMREVLQSLKTELKDLDADDLKHLYDRIEKLDDELSKRNPYKTLTLGIKDYVKALAEQRDLTKRRDEAQFDVEATQKQIEQQEELLALAKKKYEKDSSVRDINEKEVEADKANIDALQTALNTLKSILKVRKAILGEAQDDLDTNIDIRKTFTDSAQEVGKDIQELSNALPTLMGDLEEMGISFSDSMRDAVESVAEIGAGIGSAIQGFADGNYIQGILGVTQALSAIFQIGDKKKEREIQNQIKLVENLQKQYEKLKKRIEEAYEAIDFAQGERSARNNIQEQIRAYDRMIQAEEDKKKKDNKRIQEWYDAIADLREQEKELVQENIESFGGSFDFRSTTREFVDAWIDAFKETGNGLYGLQENFSEFFSNVIAEQAVMQGSSAIMKPLLDSINSALAGDYTITEKEFNAIGDLQEQQLAKLDEFLEGWYSRYGDYLEVGEMSGLQRGIEGVSESTAQIIEALLNSMRFYVADSNTQLKTLVAAQVGASDANTPNPMLAQLQIIAQQTSAIYALFDSVVGTGHPRGRSGIRVFVD